MDFDVWVQKWLLMRCPPPGSDTELWPSSIQWSIGSGRGGSDPPPSNVDVRHSNTLAQDVTHIMHPRVLKWP